ncbi:putative Leucine-rich repeat containing protein [Monocercomonoides exilis]|uniref:putative Leucine-rich repeat containing protein n=1 Tax=Monocercomonoides exilis TaxID=2049356 RepID=UPI003559F886|nr:putative Leucine-rich repeat containing protein [Monocercomonoides exilis]|eukprot:MONOS_1197.1-p1 / transcript=MONOS_1197.1 / gene=MONOS_1197 / organism=Monocercomonoides_exilis_PA203 / gene_product=Leucine-rich repeat containing protein / transcript_product=Leucine-rich repeat containing protein / location=Mono_scaffold00020:127559-129561(+) / protein_length=450 / sequence_SO=supercontig / SO=protein_coding / is_pseudo=false
MQNNLIPKIENLHKLKNLEYLNLALNLITRVENLERCESLQKLDLTCNFVVELTSVESLSQNPRFSILYLTGNPCTEYTNYRAFVISVIPQLRELDGEEVSVTERLRAQQDKAQLREEIEKQQSIGLAKFDAARAKDQRELEMKERREKEEKEKLREKLKREILKEEEIEGSKKDDIEEEKEEKEEKKQSDEKKKLKESKWQKDIEEEEEEKIEQKEQRKEKKEKKAERKEGKKEDDNEDEDDDDMPELEEAGDIFKYTPEVRLSAHHELMRKREEEDEETSKKKLKKKMEEEEEENRRKRLVREDGTIIQKNEGGWPFRFYENSPPGTITLEVKVGRFLDTSLIDTQVHPDHILIMIKGKALQLKFPFEVFSDQAEGTRSEATGVLRIVVPKVNPNASFYGGPDYDPQVTLTGKAPKKQPPLISSSVVGEFQNSAISTQRSAVGGKIS